MWFSPYVGNGCRRGGVPKVLVPNLLMQFFTLGSSDIVTTQNDHPRYVKHV